ncbi:sugar phosphate nucleotidyltransferase [Rothia sp. AR01]|uniref:Sugar phosphate nucleotidyltransferase n=1 Tax=Rothia santali TaxID=2949643 RepID=A0A9X2KH43_9MICC|nr:sugar phosphate nucleotidyltransferase [Rothia santali]MCP3425482.1 sugar phosphate nucleotidyltransferase [Rothia santali]
MSDPFPQDDGHRTVALVLAGGRGSRLSPLTDARSKPAVPVAGSYRLIDVVLSNLVHSGLRDVWVVEQYRPFTLNRHLAGGRPWDLDGTRHGLQILPPSEGRPEEGFAAGNGHALYQQMAVLEAFGAREVVVLSADHLYQLDLRPVLEQHRERGSELTVVTTEVDEDPSRYGVVRVGEAGEVTHYDYKPENPAGNLVATEIFVYDVAALSAVMERLVRRWETEGDAGEPDPEDGDPGGDATEDEGTSLGDYGESIVPDFVRRGRVHEYRLEGYWRDIGTVDAYFRAHMDLLEGGGLPLENPEWPMISNNAPAAPARIEAGSEVSGSLVCAGARVRGAVEHSVIGPGVVVERGARVSRSVLLGDTRVPSGAVLESVIADVGAPVPEGRTGRTRPGPGNITVLAATGGGADTEE